MKNRIKSMMLNGITGLERVKDDVKKGGLCFYSTAHSEQVLWTSLCSYVTSPYRDSFSLNIMHFVPVPDCVSVVNYHLPLKNDG
jgi:hypothetical protein